MVPWNRSSVCSWFLMRVVFGLTTRINFHFDAQCNNRNNGNGHQFLFTTGIRASSERFTRLKICAIAHHGSPNSETSHHMKKRNSYYASNVCKFFNLFFKRISENKNKLTKNRISIVYPCETKIMMQDTFSLWIWASIWLFYFSRKERLMS